MSSLLPSGVFLGTTVLAALWIASRRRSAPESTEARRRAARALVVAVGAQGLHFLEEAATGFPARFGALFGVPEMPGFVFFAFNLAWLAIWVASIAGVRSGRAAAFFAAWFLAIAGVLNGIAHPMMALGVGAYFPGLVSGPVVGVAGVWLGSELLRATEPKDPGDGADRADTAQASEDRE
jgi:hypothetical protein